MRLPLVRLIERTLNPKPQRVGSLRSVPWPWACQPRKFTLTAASGASWGMLLAHPGAPRSSQALPGFPRESAGAIWRIQRLPGDSARPCGDRRAGPLCRRPPWSTLRLKHLRHSTPMAICARQRACARERSAQARFWHLPCKFSDKARVGACRRATGALVPLVAGHHGLL